MENSDNNDDKNMWYSRNISAVRIKSQPKTPNELSEFLLYFILILWKLNNLVKRYVSEIPECEDSINDCAYGGKCVADLNGYKSCLCPASCPAC